jgi:hypothetical protein
MDGAIAHQRLAFKRPFDDGEGEGNKGTRADAFSVSAFLRDVERWGHKFP